MFLLAFLVIVGYAADLRWTGFPGNKLWDWFVLIFLPLSLGAVRAWRKLGRDLTPGRIAAIVAAVAAFGLFVVGGYALHWGWTGFQGVDGDGLKRSKSDVQRYASHLHPPRTHALEKRFGEM